MKKKRRVLTYCSFFIDTLSRLTKQDITEEEKTWEAERESAKSEANLSKSAQRSVRRPFEVQVELKSNVTGILLPVNMSSTSFFRVLSKRQKEWFLQTYPISIWRVSLHFAAFPREKRQLEKIENVYTRLVFRGNERSNRSRRNIASNRPVRINRSSSAHRFLSSFFLLLLLSTHHGGLVHRSNDFLLSDRLGIVVHGEKKRVICVIQGGRRPNARILNRRWHRSSVV